MRRYAVALIFFFSIMGTLPAQEVLSADSDIFQIELSEGQDFDICQSGEIVCPAKVPICDDPKVAVPVDLPSGLGFRGVAKGTTLCSAGSAVGPRRVFRITVR